MIRHRPTGSGHPYETSEDQRVPALPLDGERVELRVRATTNVRSVVCEWVVDGVTTKLDLEPVGPSMPRTWAVRTPPVRFGCRYVYRFRALATDGRLRSTRWHELSAVTWVQVGGRLTVEGANRLVPDSVRWLTDGYVVHRVRLDLALSPYDHVVGFGERYDRVDQRGQRLDAVVFEQYKSQAAYGRTYLPMPFALIIGTDHSWGFHIRTSARTWFDVGATDPHRLRVEVDLGGRPNLTVRIYDGDPTAVLREFLAEVGQPVQLPPWVFRLWASSNEWNTQAQVMAEMDRHRTEDIPVGVVVIEAWSDESTFVAFRGARYRVHDDGAPHRLADFDFPADGPWPDPKALVDELHARDIKVLLWQVPLLKMRPAPSGQAAADARVAVQRGFVVRDADGRPYRNRGWWFPKALLPDLSSPSAKDWWLAKRRYLVEEIGIDGFKTDGGEHAWGHDLRYADGHSGVDGNNRFPVHYVRAYGDLLRSCGRAPVTFSRAGFTGSQAHGIFWAGDEDSTWAGFRASIIAGITASACGIVYWGWDLAGFSGEIPDAELYLRAAGTACFMPIMQYHSEFNHHRRPCRDRTPWNIAERTGDHGVLPTFRKFTHLRERLVPYLVEQARRTVRGGPPLMRGLFFVDPADPRIWDYPLQFQLGDALLIAPVTVPGADRVLAYLPDGDWVNVWTSTRHSGRRETAVDAPLDHPPVFCRTSHWPYLATVFHPTG